MWRPAIPQKGPQSNRLVVPVKCGAGVFRRRGRGQRQQSKDRATRAPGDGHDLMGLDAGAIPGEQAGGRSAPAKWGARTARFADGSLTCNCRDHQPRPVEKISRLKRCSLMWKTVRRAPCTVIPVMTCCGHPGSSAILGLFAADGLRGRLFEAPKRAAASDRFAAGGLSPKENTAQAMLGTAAIIPATNSPPIAAARSFTF